MGRLVALFTYLAAGWLIRRDTALRPPLSKALWIPTIWAGILLSRPLSAWVGGGGSDSLEGSPVDALVYFGLIAASLYVLAKRQVNWGVFISRNWPIFLFYFFLLVSVSWAEHPFVSFKRWFKEVGNIAVALVVLTEENPQQAFRALFMRSAYLFIPLSYVFIRWFSDIGRRYSIHTGELEAIGVTTQKNNLGALILVCGLVALWDLLEIIREKTERRKRFDIMVRAGLLVVGGYLLYLCDSKTSMVCLGIAALLLFAARIPPFKTRPSALGVFTFVLIIGLALAEWLVGIKEAAVGKMGRDMTFTGRTDVWRELLALNTDPLIGTGYLSFWSDRSYQARLPEWVAYSAHNGYLEIYIDGGWLAIFFLALMLVVLGARSLKRLSLGGMFPVVFFGIYIATLIDNFSESYFARMTPIGFMFLLATMQYGDNEIAKTEIEESVGQEKDSPEFDSLMGERYAPARES